MIRQLDHSTIQDGLSADVQTELQKAYHRVQNAIGAERLWKRHLTEDQRRRLGNDLAAAYRDGGTVGMWSKLNGTTTERSIIDLAKLLRFIDERTEQWLLQSTGESSDDPDEALRMALECAQLVLVLDPREVYWQGERVDVDWDRSQAPWFYFVKVCEHAKQGRAVDAFDFPERVKPDYHIKMKSRLANKIPGFPAELAALIDVAGVGRQRLDLPPQQIRILDRVPVAE